VDIVFWRSRRREAVIPVVLARTRMKTWRSGYLEANPWRDTHSFSPFSAMDRMS
jgi:hypothetical protein